MSDAPNTPALDKAALMATYAEKHIKIQAGKSAIDDLEDDASNFAEGILKNFGTGPHKMMLDGKTYVVRFQRVAKKVRAHIMDLESLT